MVDRGQKNMLDSLLGTIVTIVMMPSRFTQISIIMNTLLIKQTTRIEKQQHIQDSGAIH
jgi:hypothetical protein